MLLVHCFTRFAEAGISPRSLAQVEMSWLQLRRDGTALLPFLRCVTACPASRPKEADSVRRDPRVAFLALRHWKRLRMWPTEEMCTAVAALPRDAVEWPIVDQMTIIYDAKCRYPGREMVALVFR